MASQATKYRVQELLDRVVACPQGRRDVDRHPISFSPQDLTTRLTSSVQEQVRSEFAALRVGTVAVEIGDALLGEHLIVDEEVARALAAGAREDYVGGVGEDLGGARLGHRLLAAQEVHDR